MKNLLTAIFFACISTSFVVSATGCTDKGDEVAACGAREFTMEFDSMEGGHCVFKVEIDDLECYVTSLSISGLNGETGMGYKKDSGAWTYASGELSDPVDTGSLFTTTDADSANGTYYAIIGSGDEVLGENECRGMTVTLKINS